jgi:hypothetical protein
LRHCEIAAVLESGDDKRLRNVHDERSRFATAGGGGSFTVTREPSRSLYWPLTTTRSPSASPEATTVWSAVVGPTVIGRASTTPSGLRGSRRDFVLRIWTVNRDANARTFGSETIANLLRSPADSIFGEQARNELIRRQVERRRGSTGKLGSKRKSSARFRRRSGGRNRRLHC